MTDRFKIQIDVRSNGLPFDPQNTVLVQPGSEASFPADDEKRAVFSGEATAEDAQAAIEFLASDVRRLLVKAGFSWPGGFAIVGAQASVLDGD